MRWMANWLLVGLVSMTTMLGCLEQPQHPDTPTVELLKRDPGNGSGGGG